MMNHCWKQMQIKTSFSHARIRHFHQKIELISSEVRNYYSSNHSDEKFGIAQSIKKWKQKNPFYRQRDPKKIKNWMSIANYVAFECKFRQISKRARPVLRNCNTLWNFQSEYLILQYISPSDSVTQTIVSGMSSNLELTYLKVLEIDLCCE